MWSMSQAQVAVLTRRSAMQPLPENWYAWLGASDYGIFADRGAWPDYV
jgi:hypothetical protein